MKNPNETLADWLRDAHAMESNLVNMLEKQSDRLNDFPALQKRIADHVSESRNHADRIAQCLTSLDEDTSALKEGIAKLTGKTGPIGAAMAADEPVKICLANIAAEHFEMACYRSLQAAADHCGESRIAEVASDILNEEEAMARFLEEQIGEVTRAHLNAQAGAQAGR